MQADPLEDLAVCVCVWGGGGIPDGQSCEKEPWLPVLAPWPGPLVLV